MASVTGAQSVGVRQRPPLQALQALPSAVGKKWRVLNGVVEWGAVTGSDFQF